MTKKILGLASRWLILFTAFIPLVVWGQNTENSIGEGVTENPIGGSITIQNPLNADSLEDFITDILNVVVQIGVPVVAIMIIYTGFLFVTAQGRDDKLKTAKESFVWVIIGAAIVLGAFVISTAIQGTIEQL